MMVGNAHKRPKNSANTHNSAIPKYTNDIPIRFHILPSVIAQLALIASIILYHSAIKYLNILSLIEI
jgi:hypothetical protein